MNSFIHFFVLIPLIGFLVSLFVNTKKEKLLSFIAAITIGMQLFCGLLFTSIWLLAGHANLNLSDILLYQNGDYQFLLDFYFDRISATYLIVGAILSLMVVMYSRFYMHREAGYKRFFNTVLFFYLGYNLTILSGNFETLFIGWEILGVSSFLLIAFYRDRFLPVRNAIKVFSIYRIGDIGLLLAMWMSHHLWHENISFQKLNDAILVHEHLAQHSAVGIFISLMILLSASAKSAQLPFSSWLPRAMEGPTPSSAIFYGSLSVHIGAFLLMRTFPFWENQHVVRGLIICLGIATTLICTGISRVQSSVKSQIAYSSIAQIGIMFVEIALGFEGFALFHFAGNAFLRTYQLLVSPSVVSYLIREQFYNYSPEAKSVEESLPLKLKNTLYVLCLKEWNLDDFMFQFIWNPIKKMARKVSFLNAKNFVLLLVPIYVLGVIGFIFKAQIPTQILSYLPVTCALIGLLLVMKSFSERSNVVFTWFLILLNHFWIALAIAYNDTFSLVQIYLYLSGVVVSGALGYWIIKKVQLKEEDTNLSQFHGHVYEYPRKAFIFLIACLGLTGFPITPTFIGEDLLFSHIREHQLVLAAVISLSFVVDGLSIIRVYARIFLGPHIKTYHDTPYRSS